jgi:transglutaminase-like putative cysteine protease
VIYEIVHRTEYRYDADVSANYSETHLIPRDLDDQTCHAHALLVDPAPDDVRERTDFFGNPVAYFSIQQPHRQLTVTATSTVEVRPRGLQLDLLSSERWEEVRARVRNEAGPTDADAITARQYILDSPLIGSDPLVAEYASASFPPGRPLVEAVLDLSSRIHRDFAYKPGATDIATKLPDVLHAREGVCQDFAHLAIGCVRSVGLPARYVSGYLETDPPPGEEKILGTDASHAWCSVFVPEVGWLDLDPTNDQVPNDRYVTTAWGRDYADVTPMKGVVFSSSTHPELHVAVDVLRVPV